MEQLAKNKRLGIGLMIAALAAVNLIYLADLIVGEPVIWLGVKSAVALIVANLAALAGLAIASRADAGGGSEG